MLGVTRLGKYIWEDITKQFIAHCWRKADILFSELQVYIKSFYGKSRSVPKQRPEETAKDIVELLSNF